jgi:hypothetical protein
VDAQRNDAARCLCAQQQRAQTTQLPGGKGRAFERFLMGTFSHVTILGGALSACSRRAAERRARDAQPGMWCAAGKAGVVA